MFLLFKMNEIASAIMYNKVAPTIYVVLILCRILNKLTPEKFDLLKGQLIDSGITSADILKVILQ